MYGFNAAIGLRVDPQDNVWTIDEVASQIIKFDPEGRVMLVLGRKPEAIGASGWTRRRARRSGRRRGASRRGALQAARLADLRGGPARSAGGGRGGGRGPAGAGTPGSTFSRPTGCGAG
jgi:hypothetical protein